MSWRMASDPSSSAGFGGSGPEAMTSRLATPVGATTSFQFAWPTRADDRPAFGTLGTRSAMAGWRKLASTTNTRRPACAMEAARFITTVVRPSSGAGEVTRMLRR